MHGGEQERGRRATTENTPGIVGFGHAAALALPQVSEEAQKLTHLRNKLIDGLMEKIDHVRLNGHRQKRLPNSVNVSIEFIEGEAMSLNLDLEGICVSTGSACSSASIEASPVLMALGLTYELAHGSLRFTLGKWTTESDIDRVLEVLPPIVAKLRAISPLLKC